MPAFGAVILLTDALTACLLFVQSTLPGQHRARHLGAAYLFPALVVWAHLLAFPGVFAPTNIIGDGQSAIWLWCVWHGGFPIAVIRFLLIGERPPGTDSRGRVAAGVVVLAAGSTLLATVGSPLLPPLVQNGNFIRLNTTGVGPVILLLSATAAVLAYTRLRLRDSLSAWLWVAMVAATLDVGLTLLGAGRFTLGWYFARVLSLVTSVVVLFSLLADLLREAGRVAEVNGQLERLLCTDVLTQVANRRAFDAALQAEWNRTRRLKAPISLLMIDIDHFKRFNDRYGHPAGDVCLRSVAGALRAELKRPGDLAARLGGEEFGLLLPMTDEAGAWHVADRIQDGISRLGIPHEASELGRVSISIGLTTLRPDTADQDVGTLMDVADRALYAAKAAGRGTTRSKTAPAEAMTPA